MPIDMPVNHQNDSHSPEKKIRPVRSFVLREGRITPGQKRALETLWPIYGLEPSARNLNGWRIFGNTAPVILEIGFGNGQALLQLASLRPDENFIGIEVHKPGVGSLMRNLQSAGLENVRLFCHDAVEILKHCFESSSFDRIHLFFPDPWHKKRHHKRRIVNADFVEMVTNLLKPNGVFHFASDWQPYVEQTMERLESTSGLVNASGTGQYTPRPAWRPETRFERRGHRLGHGVWDILMQKVSWPGNLTVAIENRSLSDKM